MSSTPPAAAPTVPSAEARTTVASNAVALVLGQVATTTLAIMLSALLGRWLGPADFGLYFLVLTTATFAFVIVEWGQMLFVVREIARDPGRAGALVGAALALRVAGALLVAGPVALVTLALGYDGRTCAFAVLFVLAMLPFSLAQAFGLAFRGRDRMGYDAAVSIANKVLLLAMTFGALGLGWGIPGVIAAQGLAGLVAASFALRLYGRLGSGPLSFSSATARGVVVGAFPILIMVVTGSVQPYIDAVVLSKLAPADAVGWYGAARNVMGTLLAPAMILCAAWYPRLSRASSDPAAFAVELRAAARPILALAALGGVGTYLFAEAAIHLIYGLEGFGPAVAVLRLFGPALFILFVDVLLGHGITALGRAREFAIAKVFAILVATGLEFWLIPWFQARDGNGGLGVVVAFAVSEILVFATMLRTLPPGCINVPVLLDLGRALLSAGVTAALFLALPPPNPFVGIPLCVAVFGAVSFAVGLARGQDLGILKAVLRRGRESGPHAP
jgi:O-antigen/teichoic acid export membrane protein